MFNGYFLTWLSFPHHTGATAILPWCFWAIERAALGRASRQRWSRWALAGVIFALPLLSHLQLALYIYLGMGGYALARALQAREWRARWQIVTGFSLAGAGALALGAGQPVAGLGPSAPGPTG